MPLFYIKSICNLNKTAISNSFPFFCKLIASVVFVGKVLKKLYPEVPHGQEKRAPVSPACRNPPEKVAPERVKGRSVPPMTGEGGFPGHSPGSTCLASGHGGVTSGGRQVSFCSRSGRTVTSLGEGRSQHRCPQLGTRSGSPLVLSSSACCSRSQRLDPAAWPLPCPVTLPHSLSAQDALLTSLLF